MSQMNVLIPTRERTWTHATRRIPTPEAGQVLIESRFVAVNNADVTGMDRADTVDEDSVVGYETAGTVVAVGPDLDPGLVGTRVAACTPSAFAQFVVADARHTIPVPDDLPLEQAAALPTALLTEHGALRAGGFRAGQTVLVTGATSAIGLVGVQLARALGARSVLATTRSAAKVGLLRDLGADHVVVGGDDGLDAEVRRLTDGEGVDLVLEHVAGDVLGPAVAACRRHGTVVQMGRLGGPSARLDVDALSFGRVTLIGVSFGTDDELAELLGTVRRVVLPLIADGEVRSVIDSVVAWGDAADAVDRVRHGRCLGKVVLELP